MKSNPKWKIISGSEKYAGLHHGICTSSNR